jgi:hypothetical protein
LRLAATMQEDFSASINRILREAVRAERADEVLVLFDESSQRFIGGFEQSSIELGLYITFLYIPKQYQLHLADRMVEYRDTAWLPSIIKNVVSNATVIINLIGGYSAAQPLRKAILSIPRHRQSRFAHIPGISEEILTTIVESDFQAIHEEGELLAWYLGNANEACVYTYDHEGKEYRLSLNLGGWDNEPIMSSGIIPKGGWGNLPPGEVYCLPEAGVAQGQVCINGSIPGIAMASGQFVILTFKEGRLVHWTSKNAPEVQGFFDKEAASALQRRDSNWNCLAELGIGLNHSIKILGGNPLFDEKAAGTIHVAIGANEMFGGPIRADRHHDLVTIGPSLKLDGSEIIRKGEVSVNDLKDARASWSPPNLNQFIDVTNNRLLVRDADIVIDEGKVKRRLCRASRTGVVCMADDNTATQLAKLCGVLTANKGTPLRELLDEYPSFGGLVTERLLSYLFHFRCVMFEP